MSDPQDDIDIPQEWLDKADARMQERILTSVDEEEYANGDWTDDIAELAAEMWAEDEEEKKWAKVDHEIERDRERQRMETKP